MKDGFDIVTDVRGLLSPLIPLLNGGAIYPSVRPSGSNKTDVVVNSLGISNKIDQVGFGNINIYAPFIQSSANGKPQTLPNQQLLSNLAKATVPLVDEVYKSTFRCWIEELPILLQDTDGSYFCNIRFRYQSIK